MARALSRATSWMERGTLRAGAFGQHRAFSACIAVELAGAIEQRVVFRHANSWRDEWAAVLSQLLSGRADIGVAFLVIGEVDAKFPEANVLVLGRGTPHERVR